MPPHARPLLLPEIHVTQSDLGFLHTKFLYSIPQRSVSINDPRKNTVTLSP